MPNLKTLLNTELQTIQTRRELIRNEVAQFTGEDDDVVGVLVISTFYRIHIAERRTAITGRQNGEEDLERSLAAELIRNDRRYLDAVNDAVPQAVKVRAACFALRYAGKLHAGI